MTDSAGRPPADAGRAERLARLTPEQRARFEARTRGNATAPTAPVAVPVTPRRDADVPAPLSFGQERLWFLDQLTPGLGVFNEYVALRLTGPLDRAALDAALKGLVVRHEALRTVVDPSGERPVQRVLDPAPVSGPGSEPVLTVVDLDPGAADGIDAAEREFAEREARRPFDLEGERLFRAVLIRSAPDRALLVVVNHHMVGDAWSRAVLVEELCAGYRAFRDGLPGGAGGRGAGASRCPSSTATGPRGSASSSPTRRWRGRSTTGASGSPTPLRCSPWPAIVRAPPPPRTAAVGCTSPWTGS